MGLDEFQVSGPLRGRQKMAEQRGSPFFLIKGRRGEMLLTVACVNINGMNKDGRKEKLSKCPREEN